MPPCKLCLEHCTAQTEEEAKTKCKVYREYLRDQERSESYNPEGSDLEN